MGQLVFARNWKNRGGVITDSSSWRTKKSWRHLAKNDKESISQLLKIIESAPLGAKLLDKARLKAAQQSKRLEEVITPGEVSVTDTTLIRRFSAIDPTEIEYEARSKVYLDRTHNVKNAVLDLVHELTHYVYKEPFNPYRPKFSITKFMKDTIEGKGGEVDAFVLECKVGKHIFGRGSISPQCQNIINREGEFSKNLAKYEFYKLGEYFGDFVRHAKKHNLDLNHLRYISRENGQLISSAWGSPYPMAVLEEYSTIMGKVCENDRKRLSYFQENLGRQPASQNRSLVEINYRLTHRCKEFL